MAKQLSLAQKVQNQLLKYKITNDELQLINQLIKFCSNTLKEDNEFFDDSFYNVHHKVYPSDLPLPYQAIAVASLIANQNAWQYAENLDYKNSKILTNVYLALKELIYDIGDEKVISTYYRLCD